MANRPTSCLPTRRDVLFGGGALTAWSMLPRVASAAGARDPRFLTIILRGALDGLTTIVPYGDPAWAALREEADIPLDGAGGLKLDGFFTLNPAMHRLHALYEKGEALPIQAVATPYRGRSHFEGQDVLESGVPVFGGETTGWLNRALQGFDAGDVAKPVEGARGLAVGSRVPLLMRGAAPVTAWSRAAVAPVTGDTVDRLLGLYGQTDTALHDALAEAVRTRAIVGEPSKDALQSKYLERHYTLLAEGAGRLLADEEGPRVGAMSFDGWDTHAKQGPTDGRLATLLGALDAAIGALEASMRPVWNQTVIAIVTEFGRTVRENGSDGTDHGTGGAAILVGGAVRGGRVLADWPGLAPDQLYEGRDLRPTLDLRSVLKGILADHLGARPTTLATNVFPGSEAAPPMRDLLA